MFFCLYNLASKTQHIQEHLASERSGKQESTKVAALKEGRKYMQILITNPRSFH